MVCVCPQCYGVWGGGGFQTGEVCGTFVTGVEVVLSVSLQMAGDVGCAEHLPTDATGDFAFVPDHVGTESVFGGKSRGTGLRAQGDRVSTEVQGQRKQGEVRGRGRRLP